MKKLKPPFLNMKRALLCFICIFSFSFCDAQKWNWAKAEVNDSGTGGFDLLSFAADNSGNSFETGAFTGTINFGTIYLKTPPSTSNAFLVKFDHSGNAVWGMAPTIDYGADGWAVASNNSGNVCLAGTYLGDSMKIGTYTFPFSLKTSLFVAMLNSSGILKWGAYSKNLDSKSGIAPTSAAIDKAGNTFVTGYFIDSISIGSIKIYGANDCFYIAKFDKNGNVIWVKTAKSNKSITSNTVGSTVVTDTVGNAYVAGQFLDSITIGSSTVTTLGNDVFLVKFDSSGNVKWLTSPKVSSPGGTTLYGMHGGQFLNIDNAGSLYLTGMFADTAHFGAYTLSAKYYGIFIAKYSPSGNVLWAKENSPFNSMLSSSYQPFSISCDKYGSFYLCGTFKDTITFNSIKLTSDSTLPSFIFKFDTSGNAVCGTEINNNNDDWNYVAADPLGDDVFFSGDNFVNGCYFGSYLITGSMGEYGFLADWTCNSSEGIHEEIKKSNEINIFPNPSNGTFTLQTMGSQNFASESIEIYNVLGEKVYSGIVHSSSFIVNLSGQPNGIYLYRVLNEDGGLIGEGKLIISK